ncbi:MAG TPA: flavin reductase [Mycobacterium sp.]|nr:flavin reductase [Mycobacterium sp.]
MQATATLPKQTAISGEDFRLAMRRLAGGVSIISGAGPDGPLAVTATAVTSLTAEPPSVVCCLNRSLQLETAVKDTGRFAVNMLRADHHDLAKRFAGMHGVRGSQKFEQGNWTILPSDVPTLFDSLVSFDCPVEDILLGAGSTHHDNSQLLLAMRDRAASGDSRELARLCEVAIELADIRSSHRQAVNDERLHMLTSGQDVSMRLSASAGVRALLERAATLVCDLPGLERGMVFQREGGVLDAAATVFADHDERARDCQALSASTRYDLAPLRLEALIIRRRSPAIVTDTLNDPNAFQPIVQKMQAANYVGAPVIAYGEVVATMHGDAYSVSGPSTRWTATSLPASPRRWGKIVQRAILIEQLQFQQRVAEQLARSAGSVLGGLGGDIAILESDAPAPIAPWQSRSEVVSDLTRREYEVLQLMAKGATNPEIATTIFLSEETVKSDVKRILQKFGVANRGQAVATYLESLD